LADRFDVALAFDEYPGVSRDALDIPTPERPMRCRKCFYVLTGLPENRCPECGTPFDPESPWTFTTKVPFVWWRFWLPAFLLALVGGLGLYLLLIPTFGFGVATTLIIPFCIGGIVGYGAKTSAPGASALGVAAAWVCIGLLLIGGMVGLALGISSGSLVGGVCGTVLAAIAITPALMGALFGWVLRRSLLRSTFAQRDYLTRSIPLLFLIIPIIEALIEGRHDNMPAVTIVTTCDMNAPPWTVWKNIKFYEQMKTPPPWPLWLSPEVRPKYTTGNSARPGDVRVCVYEHGQLKKLTRTVLAPRLLSFDVVQQHEVENRSIRLLDGAFEISPLNGTTLTRLTLRTRYIPLLYPRWAYFWSERYFVHTLHHYIMDDMRIKAERDAGLAMVAP
jgi:hypothetical protein